MPKQNPFSVWSEVIDFRPEKTRSKEALTEKDIEAIVRLFRGEWSGLRPHKLKGVDKTVISVVVDQQRRLLFMPKGSTLALVEIVEWHDYEGANVLTPGVAEKLFRQPWEAIKDRPLEFEPVSLISLDDFKPDPGYEYSPPKPCVSYQHKFITLDDEQMGAFTMPTPGVIIGDPGSGKSIVSAAMMKLDVDSLDDEGYILYFSESQGLAAKMDRIWTLDHPVTARDERAARVIFANYEKLLKTFWPDLVEGKTLIGEDAFNRYMSARLSDKAITKKFPTLNIKKLRQLSPTLYHEFQIITVCQHKEKYLAQDRRSNLTHELREWVYAEYKRYVEGLSKRHELDLNLMLFEPTAQPFYSVYHDESLSASPAINLMLHRLTKNANIIYFADPNQENKKQMSDLDYIISELGANGQPAYKKQLAVTYRLSPTIAKVANAVLAIKQNLNGGKNEKNQTSQVIYEAGHHEHPGILEWVDLERCEEAILALNASNAGYTVITYPEYLAEAKKRFSNADDVCSIDESRGQEFETAVLYRVTDFPSPPQGRHQRRQKSLLQSVGEALSSLAPELQNKPNLAKSGVADRQFESYMNGIYVALSRIVHRGLMVESETHASNQLHTRLKRSIHEAMQGVAVDQALMVKTKDQILSQAMEMLDAGYLAQARAGFLRAGKTEEEFNATLALKLKNENDLIDGIRSQRQQPGTKPASRPEQDAFSAKLRDIIAKENKKRLLNTLKTMDLMALTEEVSFDNEPKMSYLNRILQSEKLADVLFGVLSNTKAPIADLIKAIDFNMKVIRQVSDHEFMSLSLLGVICLHDRFPTSLDALMLANSSMTFKNQIPATVIMKGEHAGVPMEATLLKALILRRRFAIIERLINDDPEVLASTSHDDWFMKPAYPETVLEGQVSMVRPESIPLIHELILSYDDASQSHKQIVYQCLSHALLNNFVKAHHADSAKEALLQTFMFGHRHGQARKYSLFDLLLRQPALAELSSSLIDKYPELVSQDWLFESIQWKLGDASYVCRAELLMALPNAHALIAKAMDGPKPKLNPVRLKVYDDIKRKLTLATMAKPVLSGQALKPQQSDEAILSQYEVLGAMQGLLSDAISVNDLTQLRANGEISLLSILASAQHEQAIIQELTGAKATEAVQVKLRNKIRDAITTIGLLHRQATQNGPEAVTVQPLIFYMADRHPKLFNQLFINISSTGLNEAAFSELAKQSYYASHYGCQMNLMTLLALQDAGLTMALVRGFPYLLGKIQWLSVFKNKQTGKVMSPLLVAISSQSADTLTYITESFANRKSKVYADLDLRALFKAHVYQVKTFVNFDELAATPAGLKVLSYLLTACLAQPWFNDYFHFLFANLGKSERAECRFQHLLSDPATFDFVMKWVNCCEDVPRLIAELIEVRDDSPQAVRAYTWSIFSAILASRYGYQLIEVLIQRAPESMQSLPSSVWHCPAQTNAQTPIPQENFVLLAMLRRAKQEHPFLAFVKRHYPKDLQQLFCVSVPPIMTPNEVHLENDVALSSISAKTIIESEDSGCLAGLIHSQGLVAIHCFHAIYKNNLSVLTFLFRSEKLKSQLLKSLKAKLETSHFQAALFLNEIFMRSLGEFNYPVFGSSIIEAPKLIALTPFTYIIQSDHYHDFFDAFEGDLQLVVRGMNPELLNKPMQLMAANKAGQSVMPLNYLATHCVKLFTAICEHTDALLSLPAEFMMGQIGPGDKSNNIITRLVEPMFDESIDKLSFCHRFTALCAFLEAQPMLVGVLLAQSLDLFNQVEAFSSVLSALKTMNRLDLFDRFLQAVRVDACTYLMLKNFFDVPAMETLGEVRRPRYGVSGFTQEENASFSALCKTGNLEQLKQTLEHPLAPRMLSAVTATGDQLITKLLSADQCRDGLIALLLTLVDGPQKAGFIEVLVPLVRRGIVAIHGVKRPFIHYLLEDEQGYKLLSIVEQRFPLLYSRMEIDHLVTPYPSHRLEGKVSTLFLMAKHHLSSLSSLITHNKALGQSTEVIHCHEELSTPASSLGSLVSHLVTAPPELRKLAADTLHQMMVRRFGDILSSKSINAWFEKRVSVNGTKAKMCLFDIMLGDKAFSECVMEFFMCYFTELPLVLLFQKTMILDWYSGPRMAYFIETLDESRLNQFIETVSDIIKVDVKGTRMDMRSIQFIHAMMIDAFNHSSGAYRHSANLLHLLSFSEAKQKLFFKLIQSIPLLCDQFKLEDFYNVAMTNDEGEVYKKEIIASFYAMSSDGLGLLSLFSKENPIKQSIIDVHEAINKDVVKMVDAFWRIEINPQSASKGATGRPPNEDHYKIALCRLMLRQAMSNHGWFNRENQQPGLITRCLHTVYFRDALEVMFLSEGEGWADQMLFMTKFIHINEFVCLSEGTRIPVLRYLCMVMSEDLVKKALFFSPGSYYFVKQDSLDFWKETRESQDLLGLKASLSYLDVLMQDDQVSDILKLVINKNLKHTLQCCMEASYLNAVVQDAQGQDQSRISLMLMNEAMHGFLSLYLAQPAALFGVVEEALVAEAVLNRCASTPSGLSLLNKVLKHPKLTAESKTLIEQKINPTPVERLSTLPQGLFHSSKASTASDESGPRPPSSSL